MQQVSAEALLQDMLNNDIYSSRSHFCPYILSTFEELSFAKKLNSLQCNLIEPAEIFLTPPAPSFHRITTILYCNLQAKKVLFTKYLGHVWYTELSFI